MMSRHKQPQRPFRASPEEFDAQTKAAERLNLSWNQWARQVLAICTPDRLLRLSKAGRARPRAMVPGFDATHLVLTEGGSLLLMRDGGRFEGVASLGATFERWSLRPDDFVPRDREKVRELLDEAHRTLWTGVDIT